MNRLANLLKAKVNTSPSVVSFKENDSFLFNIGLGITLLIYLPLIFKEQLFSDEYDLLGSGNGLAEHIRRDGRPLGALIYKAMALIVDSPSDIFILRLISLISALSLIKLFSIRILVLEKGKKQQLVVIASMFLPSFVLYIFWGMLSYFIFAAAISYFAWEFWNSTKNRRRFVAVLLQTSVILIYPPSAFTTFALVGVIAIYVNESSKSAIRRIATWLIFNLISGAIAVLTVLIDSKYNEYSLNSRVKFVSVHDLPGKILWLFSRPILISTRTFDVRSPHILEAALTFALFALVIIVGLKIRYRDTKLVLEKITFFLIAILLSLTPIALSSDNQFDYRLILGPSISFFVVFGFCMIEITERIFQKSSLSCLLLVILIAIGIFSMYSHSSKLFVEPYKIKEVLIRDSLRTCFGANQNPLSISIVWEADIFDQRQNLGLFSMKTDLASSWVPVPSFQLVMKENDLPKIPIVIVGSKSKISPNSCRVDLTSYAKSFEN
jgi:hypothetical protein